MATSAKAASVIPERSRLYDSDRLHLTSHEVERLIEVTKGSRNKVRDRCLLLLMFRHGFRVSEACRLKLDQVDTESRVLACHPIKAWPLDNASTPG